MAHEAKLNQELTDTVLNPVIVLENKNIKTNTQWSNDGKLYFEVIGIGTAVGIGTTVIQSQYDTWKAEKTVSEWLTFND